MKYSSLNLCFIISTGVIPVFNTIESNHTSVFNIVQCLLFAKLYSSLYFKWKVVVSIFC